MNSKWDAIHKEQASKVLKTDFLKKIDSLLQLCCERLPDLLL